jgi:hypothetical protein
VKGTDLVHHEIVVNNILLGASTFLSLALPQTWDISMGAGRPEITASHERNGRRWVATGDAWYVLHDSDRHWAMEVRLTAKVPKRSRNAISISEITVAGHPASIIWNRRKRGLIKRWSVTYVTVEFYCPRTERQLKVEFSGRVPDEAFQEVVEATRYVRCH